MTEKEYKKMLISDLKDIYDYFREEYKVYPDNDEFVKYQTVLSNAWFTIEASLPLEHDVFMGYAEDGLAMLKAQEPVKPIVDVDTWRCENCGHKLEHQELLGNNVLLHEQYDYCPECGKAVKWDGA